MKILVKTTKTGKAKTLLVFSLSENKVSKIDCKIHLSPTNLFILISKIEKKLIEFTKTEDKRIDLEDNLYLLRQETKVFNLDKANIYNQNIRNWNALYERYMSNIYDEPLINEKRLFERKAYSLEFMESFFRSEEWFAKDKTIANFCIKEKHLLSSINQNTQPNYQNEEDYGADKLI